MDPISIDYEAKTCSFGIGPSMIKYNLDDTSVIITPSVKINISNNKYDKISIVPLNNFKEKSLIIDHYLIIKESKNVFVKVSHDNTGKPVSVDVYYGDSDLFIKRMEENNFENMENMMCYKQRYSYYFEHKLTYYDYSNIGLGYTVVTLKSYMNKELEEMKKKVEKENLRNKLLETYDLK